MPSRIPFSAILFSFPLASFLLASFLLSGTAQAATFPGAGESSAGRAGIARPDDAYAFAFQDADPVGSNLTYAPRNRMLPELGSLALVGACLGFFALTGRRRRED